MMGGNEVWPAIGLHGLNEHDAFTPRQGKGRQDVRKDVLIAPATGASMRGGDP
jgi:hypothetical protein